MFFPILYLSYTSHKFTVNAHPPLGQPSELFNALQFVLYEREFGDIRVDHCTTTQCDLHASSPDLAYTFCEMLTPEVTYNASRVWCYGATRQKPSKAVLHDETPLLPCVRECLFRVNDVYGKWESFDERCKVRMNAADGRWDNTAMRVQRRDAKRLCRDNLCTIEEDLLDLDDDMERDFLAYCGLDYYESPSSLVSDVPLLVHAVFNTTGVTEQDMMSATRTVLGGTESVTCTSWMQHDGPVENTFHHECTLFTPTEDAVRVCKVLEHTLGDTTTLGRALGASVVSATVDCTLAAVRPPPSPPWPEISNDKWYALRREAKRQNVSNYHAAALLAALLALLLLATTLGYQSAKRFARTLQSAKRRLPPFALHVGKKKISRRVVQRARGVAVPRPGTIPVTSEAGTRASAR